MNVLHLITQAERRGAEIHAVELCRALTDIGIEGEVRALARGLGHLDVPVIGPSTLHPRTLWRIRQLAKDADVVVAHGSRTLPAAALALTGTDTPTVYRSIGDPSAWSSSRSSAARVRWALQRMTRVVALWDEAADVLSGRHALDCAQVVVIPNAVAAWPAPTVPLPAAPSLLFVGSMTEEKRPRLALDAAESAGIPIRMVGEGPLIAELRELASRRDQDATFLGSIQKAALVDEYDQCWLLLVTSRTEGQPGVIAEAALRGRATLATAVGGVPSMVTDDLTGRLVSAASSPAEIGSLLRKSLGDAQRLGAVALERASAYTMTRTATQWASTLHELTAQDTS